MQPHWLTDRRTLGKHLIPEDEMNTPPTLSIPMSAVLWRHIWTVKRLDPTRGGGGTDSMVEIGRRDWPEGKKRRRRCPEEGGAAIFGS